MTDRIPPKPVSTKHIPVHGRGWLAPWAPGQCGNPGGVPRTLGDVQRLARAKSLTALRRLIELCETPADPRVQVVAAQTVLTWAFGKPPDYDATKEATGTRIDASRLTSEQRRVLIDALRAGLVSAPAEPPEIEGSAGR